MKKINLPKVLFNTFFFLTLVFLISFMVKGDSGSPILRYQGSTIDSQLGGPFESSGSNSRYALVRSMADNQSFFFDGGLAKFASPDLIEHNGKFSTLFTPGVSFIALPFYFLGKVLGLPQLLTYLTTTLFAILNIYLIAKIGKKFNVNYYLSLIGGLIFTFATSSLAYANSLTQHHISTALILLAILNAFSKRNILNNILFGILVGIGAMVDIPNLFFMLPIGIFILSKHFIKDSLNKVKLNLSLFAIGFGIAPLLILFGLYNYQTTGSYTTLAQSVGRTTVFSSEENKKIEEKLDTEKSPFPFKTRNQLNGFYILLFSNERGIFYYSPIILIGLMGLIIAYYDRLNKDLTVLLSSVILVNVLLYSMFPDPWGGWSFGPRYLIPAIALSCIAIGVSLKKLYKNPFFVTLFLAILTYSIYINVLGATTTTLVPPKTEALNLNTQIPYTYEYNLNLANNNQLGALIYNLYFKNLVSANTYIYSIATIILVGILGIFSTTYFQGFSFRRKNG